MITSGLVFGEITPLKTGFLQSTFLKSDRVSKISSRSRSRSKTNPEKSRIDFYFQIGSRFLFFNRDPVFIFRPDPDFFSFQPDPNFIFLVWKGIGIYLQGRKTR
jgi:hypothetical protein